MSVSDWERRRAREEELWNELYTMLDRGLDKKCAARLVEMIKELAVIAVAEANDKSE